MFNFAEHHQIVIDILKQSFYHIFRMRIESSPSEMAGFFILTGTNMAEKQIKSRKRVQEHAEVFTAEREVNAMLDLVNDELLRPESTFLEPACGEGNFTVKILERKLTAIIKINPENYRYFALIALSGIYAIELLPDNVKIARRRMLETFVAFSVIVDPDTPDSYFKTAEHIIEKNFVNGNTLTGLQPDGTPIKFTEWTIDGTRIYGRDYEYNALVNGTLF